MIEVCKEDIKRVLSKQEHSKQFAKRAHICLLSTRIGLLFMFLSLKAYVMIGVSVLSIITYILAMRQLREEKTRRYAYLVYFEIGLYMMIATMVMGWKWGFQLHYFSLIPTSFLYEYNTKSKLTRIKSIGVSIITFAMFLTMRLYTYYYEPVYVIHNNGMINIVYVCNIVVACGFLITYMSYYTQFIGKLEDQLRHIAEHDPLTGLYNRHYIQKLLQGFVVAYDKEQAEFTVAIIDIDNFKSINDTHGYHVGDYILQGVSEVLNQYKSQDTFIARWGGVEFMVVQTNYPHIDQCYKKLNALRKRIEDEDFVYINKKIPVTITAGLAEFKGEGDIEEIIQLAGERLYFGKRCGKNCII